MAVRKVNINEIIHYLKSQYSDDKNKKDIILAVRKVNINEIIHYLKSQYSDDKNKKDIILAVRKVNINEIIHYLNQHLFGSKRNMQGMLQEEMLIMQLTLFKRVMIATTSIFKHASF